jgi:hypothetical protein
MLLAAFGALPATLRSLPTLFDALRGAFRSLLAAFDAFPCAFRSVRAVFGSLPSMFGSLRAVLGPLPSMFGSLRAELGSLPSMFGSLRAELGSLPGVEGRLRASSDRYRDPRPVSVGPPHPIPHPTGKADRYSAGACGAEARSSGPTPSGRSRPRERSSCPRASSSSAAWLRGAYSQIDRPWDCASSMTTL